MKIGIAVTTTPNRENAFEQWYRNYDLFCPEIPLYIHNDTEYKGIAYSKNKCLTHLIDTGCTHLFLFDDDCFPVKKDWCVPYITSQLKHACYIFDRQMIFNGPGYKAYELPRGCMLYFTRECVEKAGGFDTKFEKWGFEHAELSRRIYNMGITPASYIDIPDSRGLFYSHDEHFTIQSSVSPGDRARLIPQNRKYFEETVNSNTFISYK
jgi:hypothetical protein